MSPRRAPRLGIGPPVRSTASGPRIFVPCRDPQLRTDDSLGVQRPSQRHDPRENPRDPLSRGGVIDCKWRLRTSRSIAVEIDAKPFVAAACGKPGGELSA